MSVCWFFFFFFAVLILHSSFGCFPHHWSLLLWDARKSLFVVSAAAVAVVVGALSCSYCGIINVPPRFITRQLLSVARLMSHDREEQNKQTNKETNGRTLKRFRSRSTVSSLENATFSLLKKIHIAALWKEVRSRWCSGSVCFRSPIREVAEPQAKRSNLLFEDVKEIHSHSLGRYRRSAIITTIKCELLFRNFCTQLMIFPRRPPRQTHPTQTHIHTKQTTRRPQPLRRPS